MQEIVLAGGCFWGVEEYFLRTKGIVDAVAGYVNSNIDQPSYEDVCEGRSKAAEAVKLTYDENVITTQEILDTFYGIIDPYSYFRQGMDIGRQYRTGIYYEEGDPRKALFIEDKERRQAQSERKIMVEIEPIDNFWEAEEYHQRYLQKNPNGYCHIPLPKKTEN
ncbi:MAG: peptide-methionine (S)-S-oxide reductase MsrA [Peptoniphilus sp.]|nr:peptide-methionine (S)-S-oxide reductase MsrA [Peptoniphilus sp.]MDD7363734.1 peptide-methionine (S)-S-oxide reductase MsrA [Bacillota bacterium]MDY6044119.1 peptide-methionine (S)-S-oxide reductase MsrA [Peptoniphilus sp.]